MKIKLSLTIIGLSFAILVSPNAAQAQATYICPFGGPSPGHRVVGQTPAGHGVGSALLCIPDGTEQPASKQQTPPPPERPVRHSRSVDAAFAIAWHKDSPEVWAIWNTDTVEEAEKLALKNCTTRMTKGCTIAEKGTNSYGSIARSANGILVSGRGTNPDAAKADALKNCQKLSTSCRHFMAAGAINRVFSDTGERLIKDIGVFTPSLPPDSLNKHASMVMVSEPREVPFTETAWISSGHATLEESLRTAMEACQKETGKTCETSTFSANGKIYAYRTEQKDLIIFSENIAFDVNPDKYAAEYAAKVCTERKVKCTFVAAFDAKKPGLIKRDFLLAENKK
jgi:Domain of unknown function (DUF4189)